MEWVDYARRKALIAGTAFDEAVEETGNIDYDTAAAILVEVKETENMLEEFCRPLREEFDKISHIIDAYFECIVGKAA
jgi:hypothetical protein